MTSSHCEMTEKITLQELLEKAKLYHRPGARWRRPDSRGEEELPARGAKPGANSMLGSGRSRSALILSSIKSPQT